VVQYSGHLTSSTLERCFCLFMLYRKSATFPQIPRYLFRKSTFQKKHFVLAEFVRGPISYGPFFQATDRPHLREMTVPAVSRSPPSFFTQREADRPTLDRPRYDARAFSPHPPDITPHCGLVYDSTTEKFSILLGRFQYLTALVISPLISPVRRSNGRSWIPPKCASLSHTFSAPFSLPFTSRAYVEKVLFTLLRPGSLAACTLTPEHLFFFYRVGWSPSSRTHEAFTCLFAPICLSLDVDRV